MGLPLTSNTKRLNDNTEIAKFVEELIFNITLSDFVLAEKYYVVSNIRSSIKVYKETIGNNSFIKGKTFGKREKQVYLHLITLIIMLKEMIQLMISSFNITLIKAS